MPELLELLDPAEVARLPTHEDPWSDRARRYVAAMQDDGLQAFVSNADADIRLLRTGDFLLPLVMSGGSVARWRCETCSPSSHFAHYTAEEAKRRNSGLNEAYLRMAGRPLGSMLRLGGCEKAVFINEWLWSTAPPLRWEQISWISKQASQIFPDHTLVIRGLLDGPDDPGLAAFNKAGFRLLPSRRVYLLNAADPDYRRAMNVRKDLSLHRRSGYRVICDPAELLAHTDRLVDLYTQLYTAKYSRLNQQYNERYMRMVLQNDIVAFFGLSREDRIDGFFTAFERNHMMGGPFIGYDLSAPRKSGLYRQIFALLVREAEEKGLPLNLSSGVGDFKQLRGGRSVQEYWAVFDSHLPAIRRVGWQGLASALKLHAWWQGRSVSIAKEA